MEYSHKNGSYCQFSVADKKNWSIWYFGFSLHWFHCNVIIMFYTKTLTAKNKGVQMSDRIQLSVDPRYWKNVDPSTDRASSPIWDQVMVPPTRASHQKIPFLHSPLFLLPCLRLADLPTRPSCVTTPDLWGRTWKVNEERKIWNLENLAPFDAGLIIWADAGEKHSKEADGPHDTWQQQWRRSNESDVKCAHDKWPVLLSYYSACHRPDLCPLLGSENLPEPLAITLHFVH